MTWMVHKLHVVKPWRSTSFVHRRCNKLVTTAWTHPVRGYIHRAPCGCPWLGVLKGCWNRCFPTNADTYRGYKFQDYGISFLKCAGIQCFILNYLPCLLRVENMMTSPNAVASYWTILGVFWGWKHNDLPNAESHPDPSWLWALLWQTGDYGRSNNTSYQPPVWSLATVYITLSWWDQLPNPRVTSSRIHSL